MQFSRGDPSAKTCRAGCRLCIEDQPGFVFFVRAWMGFGIFGGGMDLNREVALCIKKLHQQWEAAMWTSGQVAHQRRPILNHRVLEVVTGEWTVSNDAATVRDVFGQVGELPRLSPAVGVSARKWFVPLQKLFPTPDPGLEQGMATEGEQSHGAVLHREPGDLRVKDDIALDQTLAVAYKSPFVRRLESISKQKKLITWLDRPPKRSLIDTHQAHEAIWPVAERVKIEALGTGFKLSTPGITGRFGMCPSHQNSSSWTSSRRQSTARLGKNNAVHLADGSTVRNQSINGLGVMQTGIGVNSIER